MRRIRRSKLRRAAWVGAAMSAGFVAAELALAPISPAATVEGPSVTHSLSSAISEARGVLSCLAGGNTQCDDNSIPVAPAPASVLVTPIPPPPSPKPKSIPGVVLPPTIGFISSVWGDNREHRGIDVANLEGTPIVSVADGTVIDSGPAPGFGLWVRVRHDDGTITTYGHNRDNLVHVGEHVRAGQPIAIMGNRGESTGPHLHFEVTDPEGHKVDPSPWLTVNSAFPPAT